MSLRLRPGVAVVRRDERHLQLGIDPPHRVVLDDGPDVRRTLEALATERLLPSLPGTDTLLATLTEAGLIEPARRATPPTVAITGPASLADEAAGHLLTSGIPVAQDGSIHLLLGHGAIRRDLADPLLRDGAWHLAAVATPWGWELGPFVVPGVTACLRCVDAAYAERDPRRNVVLDQVARAGVAVPTDPAARTVAFGWLARDLLAYAAGERPTTWSATIQLGDEMPREHRWLRHPHCGCAWDALSA